MEQPKEATPTNEQPKGIFLTEVEINKLIAYLEQNVNFATGKVIIPEVVKFFNAKIVK